MSSPSNRRELLERDHLLVMRCVSGDVNAWEEIYQNHHASLLRSIKLLLVAAGAGTDVDLVEDLAAQVWYHLIEQDARLLRRFSPDRGARLGTFLHAVARDIVHRYYRSEQRRRRRERIAAQTAVARSDSLPLDRSLDEFLATLSPSERQFTNDYLLSVVGVSNANTTLGPRKSPAAIWQFRRRVRIKLQKFLGGNRTR